MGRRKELVNKMGIEATRDNSLADRPTETLMGPAEGDPDCGLVGINPCDEEQFAEDDRGEVVLYD